MECFNFGGNCYTTKRILFQDCATHLPSQAEPSKTLQKASQGDAILQEDRKGSSETPIPEGMTVCLSWFLSSVLALPPHFQEVFRLSSSYAPIICRLINLPIALVLPGLGGVPFFSKNRDS